MGVDRVALERFPLPRGVSVSLLAAGEDDLVSTPGGRGFVTVTQFPPYAPSRGTRRRQRSSAVDICTPAAAAGGRCGMSGGG